MNQDVIYIEEERNADHRTQGGGRRPATWGRPAPARTVVVPAGNRRPMVIQPGTGTSEYGYTQPQVIVAQQPPPSFASRFGMTTGELLDTGIQILAALLPLPVPPVAQDDPGIDIAAPALAFYNGTPYVAWREGLAGASQIFVKHWDGATWRPDGARRRRLRPRPPLRRPHPGCRLVRGRGLGVLAAREAPRVTTWPSRFTSRRAAEPEGAARRRGAT